MAIAFVGAADGGNNGGTTSSRTFSYTCGSGSGRLLVVNFAGDTVAGSDNVTSVTYNSIAMTLIAKTVTGGSRFNYAYYLLNPASGANNVVITVGSNHYIIANAADYSGVLALDNSTTHVTGSSVNTLTSSLTTIADNSWVTLFEEGYNGNPLPTAGTGAIRRTADAAFGSVAVFDSNGVITPAGSYSMTTNRTSNSASGISHIMASFSPVLATARLRTLMGTGL